MSARGASTTPLNCEAENPPPTLGAPSTLLATALIARSALKAYHRGTLAEILEALTETARRDIAADQPLGVQFRPTLSPSTPAIRGMRRRTEPGTQRPQRGYPEERYSERPFPPHRPQAADTHHPEAPPPLTDAQRRPQAVRALGTV